MTREEIRRRVVEAVAEQAGVPAEQVAGATHFVNDLGFDSLDLVELTMEVEEVFDIRVPDEAGEKMRTVDEVVEFVEKEAEGRRVTEARERAGGAGE